MLSVLPSHFRENGEFHPRKRMGRDRLIRHILNADLLDSRCQPSEAHDQAASDMYIRRIIMAWTFSRRQTAWSGTPFLKVVHIIRPRAALVNRFREILRTVLQGFYTAAPFENPHAFRGWKRACGYRRIFRKMPHGSDGFFAKEPCAHPRSEAESTDSAAYGFAGAVLGAAPAHFSWKNSISSPTGRGRMRCAPGTAARSR